MRISTKNKLICKGLFFSCNIHLFSQLTFQTLVWVNPFNRALDYDINELLTNGKRLVFVLVNQSHHLLFFSGFKYWEIQLQGYIFLSFSLYIIQQKLCPKFKMLAAFVLIVFFGTYTSSTDIEVSICSYLF